MYEVEKNFNLAPDEKARLLEGAEAAGVRIFTDVYFDTPSFDLTKHDIWLRKRGERFELKLPAEKQEAGSIRRTKQYLEIEDVAGIRQTLNLPDLGTLDEAVAGKGFSPFCVCTTERASFRKQGFNIDLDHVTYDDAAWAYDTSEVELLVPTVGDMAQATDKIMDFAKRQGLKTADMPGKVIEFLRRERPDHYRALLESGSLYDPRA